MHKVGFIGLSDYEKDYFSKKLSNNFELLYYDDTLNIDNDIEAISVSTNCKITKEIINSLPKLQLISCRSTGYDNIDIDAVKKHRITLTNTPGYGSSSVAEYTFALILTLSRKLPEIFYETFAPEPNRHKEQGFDLYGKTIGIIGLGSIGKGVAQIAYGFGMRILAYDINKDEKLASWLKIEYVDDVSYLLSESDIVTLHIPYTPENHHFINTEKLSLMKKSALLINTARGDLVDTVALLKALKNNSLAGSALDVIEDELLLDPDELINLAISDDKVSCNVIRNALAILALERIPNAVITNHNAYNTKEAVENILSMTVENISGFFNNKKIYIV